MRMRRRSVSALAALLLTALAAPTTGAAALEPPPSRPTVPARVVLHVTGPGYVIGDSVLLGARSCVAPLHYVVDAKGSRQAPAAAEALAARLATLPSLVVVHMGTNGGMKREWIDRIMRVLGPKRLVVWVTVQLPANGRYSHEAATNATIREVVNRYPNTRVADWNAVSDSHVRQWMWADGIHLQPAGCRAFATLINSVARA
jgi:hypothetical protein